MEVVGGRRMSRAPPRAPAGSPSTPRHPRGDADETTWESAQRPEWRPRRARQAPRAGPPHGVEQAVDDAGKGVTAWCNLVEGAEPSGSAAEACTHTRYAIACSHLRSQADGRPVNIATPRNTRPAAALAARPSDFAAPAPVTPRTESPRAASPRAGPRRRCARSARASGSIPASSGSTR